MERRVLEELYQVIADRKENPREGSYTCYLFKKGRDEILKKLGEEAVEVIIAAKSDDTSHTTYEVADLIYHTLVMMVETGISLDDLYRELESRSGMSGFEHKKLQGGQ
ncbi:MAG: phosphoribosyl-ATP diphosphatase [Nitrospirae bacterium]|nr:MAG: phosphoribosyl-ATP diphosphatase [Nitrospirota bacterium]